MPRLLEGTRLLAAEGVADSGTVSIPVSVFGAPLRDADGRDETIFLAPLEENVETGHVAAQRWLARYEGAWNRSVDPVFTEAAY